MMKKQLTTWTKKVMMLFVLGFLVLACEEDENIITSDDTPPAEEEAIEEGRENPENGDETGTEGANLSLLTQSLNFRNSTVLTGVMPIPENLVADLKIDTDTIFWTKGVVTRIKILKPATSQLSASSFYAQVSGSDTYLEAEFEVEQENDTLVFLNFDFDDSVFETNTSSRGSDIPRSFDLKIVPRNDVDGLPIDDFELPVVVEESFDGINPEGANCWKGYWHWMETVDMGQVVLRPYRNVRQEATVGGCCDSNGGIYLPCLANDPNFTEVSYNIDYFVIREWLYFSEVSDVRGAMRETSTNLDITFTDICNNAPAYITNTIYNTFEGNFSEIDGVTRSIDNLEGRSEEVFFEGESLGFFPLPIYVGSGPFVEYKLLSKHFMKEFRNNPDGPEGGLERLYYKRFSDPEAEFVDTIWFDVCGVCTRN